MRTTIEMRGVRKTFGQTTVVMASHTISDIERIADHLVVLLDGVIRADTSVDQFKHRLTHLQVVMPPRWSPSPSQYPEIKHIESKGRVWLLTIDGPVNSMEQKFHKNGAILVEPLEMDLSDAYQKFLQLEGYTREALRW